MVTPVTSNSVSGLSRNNAPPNAIHRRIPAWIADDA
jgi:hypothetical protein